MNADDIQKSLRLAILGRWSKVTQVGHAEHYPDHLTFSDNGTFLGSNEPSSKYHPRWDVGRFQIVSGEKLELSTSNDALVDYPMTLAADELTLRVDQNQTVSYRRVT